MTLYETSITFVYRNGSEFTETYGVPLNVSQLADRVVEARERVAKESNIVKIDLQTKVVDTQN